MFDFNADWIDYAAAGVRMNAVAPGVIETPMTDVLFKNPELADVVQGLVDATPVKRAGQPGEIADLVLYLLSPETAFICGSVIFIDGGYDAATRSDHI